MRVCMFLQHFDAKYEQLYVGCLRENWHKISRLEQCVNHILHRRMNFNLQTQETAGDSTANASHTHM